MILLLENNFRGGISSVMVDRYVKSDEKRKILYMDATILIGHFMSQLLPYDEIKFEKNGCLNEITNTPEDNEIGNFLEILFGKFKIETPKSIWIDEFITSRSKMYAFRCGDDSKRKLKDISKSQSKNIKFEQYKKMFSCRRK